MHEFRAYVMHEPGGNRWQPGGYRWLHQALMVRHSENFFPAFSHKCCLLSISFY
jgi:hypothetical protein